MNLKKDIVFYLKEKCTYDSCDDHIIDVYCSLVVQIDTLNNDIKERGVMYIDENGMERTNPSLRSLSALMGQLAGYAKLLGITPYGRKLTANSIDSKKKSVTKASQLKPRVRKIG